MSKSKKDSGQEDQSTIVQKMLAGTSNFRWNFTSDQNYVCFLTIGNNTFPVIDFILTSSISNLFKIEVSFLSKHEISFLSIAKKIASLSMFFNESTQQYYKIYKAQVRKFYYQGNSFILESMITSSTPNSYHVYKVELYPELYELTLKTRNYIYKSKAANTKFKVAKEIIQTNYNIRLSSNVVEEGLKEHESITQYQESDFNFVIRMIEDSNFIVFYDLSLSEPKLTVIQNSSGISMIVSKFLVTKPVEIKGNYQQEELISLFVDQDHSFKAKIASCRLYAGSCFYLSGNISNLYFITSNVLKFEYSDSQWKTINEVQGFVVNKAKNFLIKTQTRPIIPGMLRGVVVSNSKNTFHVNKEGKVQVRLLWHAKDHLADGERYEGHDDSGFFGSDIKEKEIFDIWDLNKESHDVTRWVPVSQWGNSGDEFGNYNIPRAGQEVSVWFYQGDPDRPVVMGCIYNSSNLFPNTSSEKDVPSILGKTKRGITSLVDSISLQSIASDHDIIPPNISAAAANVVFKHYAYDAEHGTRSNRFNEISMINNYNKEKIHVISSNLINMRSDNEMHIQVNSLYRTVFENQTETVNKKRNVYLFGDDNYTICAADRINYYLSLKSKRSFIQSFAASTANKETGGVSGALLGDSKEMYEQEMILHKEAKTAISKGVILPFFLGGNYSLSIYDLALNANIFFAGALVNFLMLGNIANYCAAGEFSVLANSISLMALGLYSVMVLGNYGVTVAGRSSCTYVRGFSQSVIGIASFSFSAMTLSVGRTEIKTGDIIFKSGDAKIKTGNLDFKAGKTTIEIGKSQIKAGDVGIETGKFSLKCLDFSVEAAKISFKSIAQVSFKGTIFSVTAGAQVALKAAIIQLG